MHIMLKCMMYHSIYNISFHHSCAVRHGSSWLLPNVTVFEIITKRRSAAGHWHTHAYASRFTGASPVPSNQAALHRSNVVLHPHIELCELAHTTRPIHLQMALCARNLKHVRCGRWAPAQGRSLPAMRPLKRGKRHNSRALFLRLLKRAIYHIDSTYTESDLISITQARTVNR